MQLNPYLMFDGTAREALDFYARVLGGEVTDVTTFAEMPDMPEVPEGDAGKLAHGRVRFGDRAIMVSDTFQPQEPTTHSGFTLQTERATVEEARAVFDALAEGGEVTMPFAETSWARGFGMCRDRFGVGWMVNCE